MERKRIAVIRIKGVVKTPREVKDTLYLLKLRRTNTAVVIDNKQDYIGMIKKVEPWVAWGEIKPEVFKELLLKRGRLEGNKRFTETYLKETLNMSIDDFVKKFFNFEIEIKDVPKLKPYFRLKPPSNGYGKKGIKKPHYLGGAYGYWGEEMNDLLIRMM